MTPEHFRAEGKKVIDWIADYFFDNLITDWIVQSKINQSLDACRQMFSQISVLMIRLRESDAATTAKYRNYEQELTSFLEQVE